MSIMRNGKSTAEDIVQSGAELAEGLYRDGAIRGIDPRVNTATSFITGFHGGVEWALRHPTEVARLNKELHDLGDMGGAIRKMQSDDEDDGNGGEITVLGWN